MRIILTTTGRKSGSRQHYQFAGRADLVAMDRRPLALPARRGSDPLPLAQRRSRRRWVGLDDVPTVEPRYRGYADALEALRRSSLA